MSDYLALREWRRHDQELNTELERRRAAQETLTHREQQKQEQEHKQNTLREHIKNEQHTEPEQPAPTDAAEPASESDLILNRR